MENYLAKTAEVIESYRVCIPQLNPVEGQVPVIDGGKAGIGMTNFISVRVQILVTRDENGEVYLTYRRHCFAEEGPLYNESEAKPRDVVAAMAALGMYLRIIPRRIEDGVEGDPKPQYNSRGELISFGPVGRAGLKALIKRYWGQYLERWEKIKKDAEIARSDLILLDKEERAELIAGARALLEEKLANASGKLTTIDFTAEDLSFAPNSAWAAWALTSKEVATVGRWHRTTFDTVSKAGVTTVKKIAWEDTTPSSRGKLNGGTRWYAKNYSSTYDT